MALLLRIVAVVCFAIALAISVDWLSSTREPAWVVAGLLAWVLSTVAPEIATRVRSGP